MSAPAGSVEIHYLRPPQQLDVYSQPVAHDGGEYVVTYLAHAARTKDAKVGERVVLQPGSPVVWFTYRGDVWHDVGRFHLADGTFTGFYANVLTPVEMGDGRWDTTDLFLDVWLGSDGVVEVLDRDELDDALRDGVVTPDVAARAEREAERLAAAARAGDWPPPHVREWTLERVRAALGDQG
ncbi:MAG TPA: DUF402 domain-containing protein [Longimicrobium sp.]|nr:DUF402 domain-containing protein [Longimicrobium sp.]